MSRHLRDVADVHYGKSPKEVLDQDGIVPVVGTGGLYGRARLPLFTGPAVVVPRKGSLGNPQYVEDAFWPVDTTYAVLPKREVDARWIYYTLDLFDLTKLNEATGVPSISRDWLYKVPVGGANGRQQQRIAEILSTVDAAIEQTETLIAKTQQINAGLMHDLFTRGVTPDGQLRPARDEAPKLYKTSPLGWIPKEWEAGRLYEKRRPGRPHLKTGPFGSSLKLEHWVEHGRPVITIGALGEGEFLPGELLHVSEETAELLREYQLDVGDVVFSRVADVGRSAAIGKEQKGWIMSSNLMRISLDCGLVLPGFLQAQLAHDARVRRQIRATVNAGGRDVANSAILNRLSFSWPLKEEQELIINRFASLEASRRSNVESLEKLRHMKAGLMHDLLTGRVLVTDAQKAAANV